MASEPASPQQDKLDSPPEAPSPRPRILTTIGQVLTADLDESKFHFLHPRRIPWIQSPLKDGTDEEDGEGSGAELAPEETRESVPEAKPTVDVVVKKDGHEHHHFGPDPFELAPDEPPLRYQTESSTIQLFYDLFFVANLTTFTARHEVSNGESMSSSPSHLVANGRSLAILRRLLWAPLVHLVAGCPLRHSLWPRLRF